MNSKYLTVKDVAILLGIKPVTVYKWIGGGQLEGTYVKIGGIYRFSLSRLNRLMFGGKEDEKE